MNYKVIYGIVALLLSYNTYAQVAMVQSGTDYTQLAPARAQVPEAASTIVRAVQVGPTLDENPTNLLTSSIFAPGGSAFAPGVTTPIETRLVNPRSVNTFAASPTSLTMPVGMVQSVPQQMTMVQAEPQFIPVVAPPGSRFGPPPGFAQSAGPAIAQLSTTTAPMALVTPAAPALPATTVSSSIVPQAGLGKAEITTFHGNQPETAITQIEL